MTLSDLRGGNSFTFHLCTNFDSGFTSHIGELQIKVGKVLSNALLLDISL